MSRIECGELSSVLANGAFAILKGERVLVGQYWLSYLGQGVCGALNVLELIGGAEELATVPRCLRKRSEKNL
jgi:hypothetical protein